MSAGANIIKVPVLLPVLMPTEPPHTITPLSLSHIFCTLTLLCDHTQVDDLAADVAAVKGLQQQRQQDDSSSGNGSLQEMLDKLTEATNKRHTRMETAIYQVRLCIWLCLNCVMSGVSVLCSGCGFVVFTPPPTNARGCCRSCADGDPPPTVVLYVQVAHQVDMLDTRVKQEQQSTLRALQSLMSVNLSPKMGGGELMVAVEQPQLEAVQAAVSDKE